MLCTVVKPCSISTGLLLSLVYSWPEAACLGISCPCHDCCRGNSQSPIPSERSKIRELRNRIFILVGFQNLCWLFGPFGLWEHTGGVSVGPMPQGNKRWCLDKGNLISGSWASVVLWMIRYYLKSLFSCFRKDPLLTCVNLDQAEVALMNVICKYPPECLSIALKSYHCHFQPAAWSVWFHYLLWLLFPQWVLELHINPKDPL